MQWIRGETAHSLLFPPSKWPALILCCALGAVSINMLLHHVLPVFFSGIAHSASVTGDYHPWQWAGPHQDVGYWFDEFQDTLAVMQNTYWNGTYWPTTIQWMGAFLDTQLASSDRSFVNALEEYDGNVPGADTSASSIRKEIQRYFSEIEAYYGDEDVIQIFGAAYDDA